MRSRRSRLSGSALALTALLCGCAPKVQLPPEESVKIPGEGTVVVHVEAARSIAGPILKSFTEQTGIQVEATYREASGDGFLDRVAAAATSGGADVFWGTTPLSAMELDRRGVVVPFRPVQARLIPSQYVDRVFHWIGFAVNPRVLVYNNNALKPEEAPGSIDDLLRPPLAGKGALARIAEGSPAFAAAALITLRGPERTRAFYEEAAARGNLVVDREGEVPKVVGSGRAAWGVTDLDVAIQANREGAPLHITYPRLTLEAFVVPHVAAVLLRAPHPDQAKGLVAFLLSTEAAYQLGQNDRALITLLPSIPKPDWLPSLGAFNVTQLDNQKVFEAWRANADFLAPWGTTVTRTARDLTPPTAR